MLLCSNSDGAKELYIGYTENLKNRVKEHTNGEVKTTKKFNKVSLIYFECCLNKSDAMERELQLKTGFGRSFLKRRLGNFFNNMK